MLIVAFAYTPYHLYRRSGFAKVLVLRQDLVGIERENRELRAEIERMTREAERLRDDPQAIEQVARHELGWVRPGDIVVDLGGRAP